MRQTEDLRACFAVRMSCFTTASHLFAAVVIAMCYATAVATAEEAGGEPSRPMILAHYMPWYAAKPVSPTWGWHWTMNAFDPDKEVDGRRQIASRFYPMIGPYDSGDPHVLECQL